MALRQAIIDDAATVFCNADDFAEAVVYHPHRFYGAEERPPRTINAVVMREAIAVIDGDGDTVAPMWEVHVANDATLGISSSELDLGGDKISLAPRVGETPERRSITRLIGHDEGMLILECR